MEGFLNLSGITRIFILGAGFSAPSGIPLTNKLLKEVHSIASKEQFSDENTPFGQADWLLEQLQFYYPLANFSHENILNEKLPKDFDLEKFISYVSVESTCQLNTGERFDEHGNRFLSYFKRWIAQAIYKYQHKAISNIPEFYHKFSSLIDKSIIFTFNWDTLLESVCSLNNIPYELDSRSNFKPEKISIFKLHGSIDWFSYPLEYQLKKWMDFEQLGKTLKGLYRAKTNQVSLNKYYEELLTPWIIVPSYDKISQIKEFGDQWTALYMFFQNELEIIVVGFSMREDDYHSRAIIYPQLVQGSKEGYITVKVIDFAKTEIEKNKIKRKFKGIENCKFYFDGFSSESLDFIKNN